MLPGRRCPLPTRKGAPYTLRFDTPLLVYFAAHVRLISRLFESLLCYLRVPQVVGGAGPSAQSTSRHWCGAGDCVAPCGATQHLFPCMGVTMPLFLSACLRLVAPLCGGPPFCCRPLNRTVSVQSQSFARRPLYPQAAYRLVARFLGLGNRSLYVRFLAARLVKPVYSDTCHVSRSPAQI